MENKNKAVYQLRKKDFIPIVGIKKHMDRCINESSPLTLTSEWYISQCWARDCALAFYNVGIVSGTIVGLAKLLINN